ncbi:hypothetical protein ACFXG4_08360 [Nocardia sp. NPDC059246]|uniref:hypothetical protein n=1 Tax=unclassified Nocardia TaxID=2637762 RepID=UPI00369228B4
MPTILAVNDDAQDIAARLLSAAGDQPDRVQVVTGGKYLGFEVDDDLARAAGFVIDDQADGAESSSTPVVNAGSTEIPDPDSDSPETTPAPAQSDASADAGEPVADDAGEDTSASAATAPAKRTSRAK